MGLHLGILQTGQVLPQLQGVHGDYCHMFRALFNAIDPSVTCTDYDVQLCVPDKIDCDAYVLTGSKCSVYDPLPWIAPLVTFVEEVLDAGKKVIGVCFGHQLMAHFFGGAVAPAPGGWVVGVHQSRVIHKAPWMRHKLDVVALLASHKDQVYELPEGAVPYLSSDLCPVGGFTLGNQVITVQGHPEFQKGYSQDLMNRRRELLGEAVYASGQKSLVMPTDEMVVGRWLLDFVRGERD